MTRLIFVIAGFWIFSTSLIAAPLGGVAPISQDSTPNITAINNRIDATLRLIHENVRTRAITRAQGQTLLTQLQTAINQFMGYLKANNAEDLNSAQLSALKGLFDNMTTGLTSLPTPLPTLAPN